MNTSKSLDNGRIRDGRVLAGKVFDGPRSPERVMASGYVDFAVDIHSKGWLGATTTPAEGSNLENVRHPVGTTFRRSGLTQEKIMKLGYVVSAVIAGSAVAAI